MTVLLEYLIVGIYTNKSALITYVLKNSICTQVILYMKKSLKYSILAD